MPDVAHFRAHDFQNGLSVVVPMWCDLVHQQVEPQGKSQGQQLGPGQAQTLTPM
jgi:hypothetical protein